jgi:hypothetical protein
LQLNRLATLLWGLVAGKTLTKIFGNVNPNAPINLSKYQDYQILGSEAARMYTDCQMISGNFMTKSGTIRP